MPSTGCATSVKKPRCRYCGNDGRSSTAVHRNQRNAKALGRLGDGVLGLVPYPRGEAAVERRDLLRCHRELEPVVVEFVQPWRTAHQLLERHPVVSVRHVEVDVPVAAGEERRGPLLVEVVAAADRCDFTGDEAAQYAVGPRYQHRVRGDVDEFAVAAVQRREQTRRHAQRRVQTGLVIGKEAARTLEWRQCRIGVAGSVIAPAAGVEHVDALGVPHLGGCVDAERGDRAEHHFVVAARQLDRRRVIVDDRVRRGDDVVERLRPSSTTDFLFVFRYANRLLGVIARVGLPVCRPFDLDDLGAEVGEQLSAVFPGHRLGQFDDADAVQCRHGSPCGSGLLAARAAQPPLGREVHVVVLHHVVEALLEGALGEVDVVLAGRSGSSAACPRPCR